MSENKYIELENHLIKFLMNVLVSLKLGRPERKIRRDIFNLISTHNANCLEEEEALKVEYADKDDKGNPIIEDRKYKVTKLDEFNQAYNDLMNETVKINIFHAEEDILKKSISLLEGIDVQLTMYEENNIEYLIKLFKGELIETDEKDEESPKKK